MARVLALQRCMPWGHKLVGHLPLFLDDAFLLRVNLVVGDLKTNLMITRGESSHGGVVIGDAILVLLSFEWGNKDGIWVTMIGSHDVLISTARADGEATSVIGVEF